MTLGRIRGMLPARRTTPANGNFGRLGHTLRRSQFRGLVGAAFIAGIFGVNIMPVALAEPISEQEAHAIGVSAYVYFYPLITMDLMRRQLTNGGQAATPIQGPMNTFVNVGAYPAADMKVVVRPNFDTL
jgi:hypothetical protein